MNQNLDRNKLADSIKKTKSQNFLFLTINSKNKDSFKEAVTQIQKYFGNSSADLVVIKKV